MSSVGVKYERLEIPQAVQDEKEDEEMAESFFGDDTDFFKGFYGNLLKKMYKSMRRFYR